MISNPENEQDRKLLDYVVTSLEGAAKLSLGAAKLCEICRMLRQSALKSIDESRQGNQSQTHRTSIQSHSANPAVDGLNYHEQTTRKADDVASEHQILQNPPSEMNPAITATANAHETLSVSDNARELFVWFEDFFGCNTSMLDILETDQTQVDWDLASL